jgi:hypothetical protein
MKPRSPPLVDPFEIQEDHPFLMELNTAVWKVMGSGNLLEGLPRLNRHERLFICLDNFLTNTEADGIGQYFYYEEGVLYQSVLEGLLEIGANRFHARAKEYLLAVFGDLVPPDVAERQRVMEASEVEDEAGEGLGDCSEVYELLALWARSNREHFRVVRDGAA